MYLKSITLKGFKSFPDRTRLEFGPGVSVIVGPNGSGKSNVTDAVLWALGEQSPVAVRGQSMQDVIFGGAPGRQAGKAAEVELVLDDSEGALGLGAPEVSIVRRLDRTGEGEYRLAGARCRLVDVIELLSDTGLGKEMHSVISQGRVESIVTSKPRDRRMLIEEAAGLGKHRKRRRRAQLKLGHTQDNLDRALDVEREARSRLRPLKRQAEAADLHARLERQTLETRWELSRDDLRVQREAVAQAQDAAQQARSRAERVERELEQVSRRREAAEEKLALRSAHREELSRRLYVAQSAGERVSYRAEAVRAVSARIDAALARSAGQLTVLESQAQADVDDPEARARIAGLETELEALERDREAELARQIQDLEQHLAAAATAIDDRAGEVERTRLQREQTDAAVEQAREAVRSAERGVETARREAARVGAELAASNQFLRAQTPPPGAATALSDELEVDAGYELALAAALDGRLRAAVVGDRRDGAALLDRAGTEGGRALVAPVADVDLPAPASPPTPGAERLADRIRGADAAVRLARSLLGDTWVVESLDQVPEQFAGVAVTRAGRVWSGLTRELRQAPAVGEERVLAERNRRDQLIAASEAAAQAEQVAAATLERAGADASRCDAEAERATAVHRAAVRARDEAGEEHRRIEAMIEHRRAAPDDGPEAGRRLALTTQVAAERDKLERLERERAERRARLERVRQAVASAEALRPGVARVLESLAAAAEAIAQRRGGFEDALAADRQAGEHVAAELKACAQQEATLHTQLHSENEARTETEVRLQRAGDRAGDLERELAALASRLQLDLGPAEQPLTDEEREALASRLERLTRRREQLGPVNPLAQQEYAEAVEHVEELERQRADLEDAMRELEKLIADTDRQIRETFEQTFEAAARNFEQVAPQLFPGGSGRLRLVAERDGPARVLGGATPPNDDEDASDESVEDDPAAEEDLLGVEIEITPAGKEMKRLTLLSGGEKSMTALAFLFAVFLARPCPFYILDEVEAALDDLNIDRFLELLRVYSSHAQFIVVTHQKRTMEAADSLYGVSMSGDGISKVISRRLARDEAAA
ncbi:MAG TPA: AAA family ATPase [Solirubrobacteraceae bacterium]|nr:AAA family ATPase [Solirubrobacteraceae bacterium]